VRPFAVESLIVCFNPSALTVTTGSAFSRVETFYCKLFCFFASETGLLVAGITVEKGEPIFLEHIFFVYGLEIFFFFLQYFPSLLLVNPSANDWTVKRKGIDKNINHCKIN
jgi:hypothetical protein